MPNFGPSLSLIVICLINLSAGILKPEDEASTTEEKFKVLRIVPKNEDELTALRNLYRKSTEFELDFWKEPSRIGTYCDVMVPPGFGEPVSAFLNDNRIQYEVIIDDVQRLIEQREKQPSAAAKLMNRQGSRRSQNGSDSALLTDFFSKRMKDDATASGYFSRNQAHYGFGEYHSYSEILKWLNEIEQFYPQLARVFTIGATHEGRPIRGIKIGNPINDVIKRAVWVDGGIHAREWASIHTALYFIDQLISEYGVDPQITAYVNTLNFYIVPVANPDGFEYSRSDVTPQTRFWRKNRGPQVCRKDRWSRIRCCGGVDLNRNFDFHWGETGSSDDMCSDIYQGSSAFSEPESRAIRDKIMSSELNGKVDAFITLHTYSQMWIHPYNHERKSFPEDILDLQDVGMRGVRAIEQVYGTKYRFGTGADILYPSAGGSDDWAKAHAHIKYVYLLELRPGEDEWSSNFKDGFLLDRRQLVPTGKETWEGVKVVIDAVIKKAQQQQQQFQPPFPVTPPVAPPTTVLQQFFTTTQAPPPTSWFTQPWTRTQQQQWPPQTTARPPPPPPSPPQNFEQQQQQRFQIAQPALQTFNPPPLQQQQGFNPPPPFQQRIASRRLNEQDAQQNVLRNSLHDKLARLRQQQLFAVRDHERKQAEQKRQLALLQSRQNQLNSRICEDKSQWCMSWIRAAPQICRTSTVYMRQDCRRSCGFCLPAAG